MPHQHGDPRAAWCPRSCRSNGLPTREMGTGWVTGVVRLTLAIVSAVTHGATESMSAIPVKVARRAARFDLQAQTTLLQRKLAGE